MTHGTYLIKDYQNQIDNLLEENEILEQGFAKTSFMGTIGEKTQEMSFERVKEVKYIQILDASAFLPKTGNINN
jgi:S-adenosylmethionine synthetase